ncbi:MULTISPECIES: hypothetical protein [unclassified Leifsonia]|uniref:hypothetical protein n=1 Tax=unclassified Leifsonia TaxID=2663824 RepID=UPI0006FC8EC4|nr:MULTISPECIES: hypothetical protein [unclassified Leifsonia]KQX07955.1 hypothetical protein ASC59_09650 [Leifsonia sp. Root1293]KRA12236.1 hypothetical protein ASD61_09650 [Leifsonia sp. Root60]
MSVIETPPEAVEAQESPDESARGARKAAKQLPAAAPKQSKSTTEVVEIGGTPRVDLLPPEVRAQAAVRRIRGRALLALVLAVALVLAGTGYAVFTNVNAQLLLANANQRTGDLVQKQADYAIVTQVEQATQAVHDAQALGGWTEIDWRSFLQAVQATLPAGVTITAVNVDSASPTEAYAQSTVPLEGARIATLTFTATSSDIPQIPAWLDALRAVPGFTDAMPTSVNQAEGGYTVNMIMHINDSALSKRFLPDVPAGDAGTPAGDSADTAATGAAQ